MASWTKQSKQAVVDDAIKRRGVEGGRVSLSDEGAAHGFRVKEMHKNALQQLENNVEVLRPLVVREAVENWNAVKAMEDAVLVGFMETND